MKNRINNYLMTQEKKRVVSYLHDENLIEESQNILEKNKCSIVCLGKKKKVIFHKTLEGVIGKEIFDIMFKSHMVIIKTDIANRERILQRLKAISKFKQRYAPIVSLKNGYVLLFPKLGYQDSYFVKSLVENYEFDYEMVY